jgi:hypothetical protein
MIIPIILERGAGIMCLKLEKRVMMGIFSRMMGVHLYVLLRLLVW